MHLSFGMTSEYASSQAIGALAKLDIKPVVGNVRASHEHVLTVRNVPEGLGSKVTEAVLQADRGAVLLPTGASVK